MPCLPKMHGDLFLEIPSEDLYQKKTPKKQNKQQTSVCVIFFVRSAKVKSTEIRAWLVTKEKCSELVAWKQRQRI